MSHYGGNPENNLDHIRQRMKEEDKHHYVSFSDVMKHPIYKAWISSSVEDEHSLGDSIMNSKTMVLERHRKPPRDVLEKILYGLFLDVNKPIQEHVCTHRNYNGKVVDMVRYEGTMRSDDSFMRMYKRDVLGG